MSKILNVIVSYSYPATKTIFSHTPHIVKSGIIRAIGAHSIDSAIEQARNYHKGSELENGTSREIHVGLVIAESGEVLYSDHGGYITRHDHFFQD